MKTWEEFLDDPTLTLDDFVAEQVAATLQVPVISETIDRMRAETAAAERRSAELLYEQAVRDALLRGGILPRAVDLMVADVQEVFTFEGGTLVAGHGITDPGDPLAPLTVETWLEGQRAHVPFLFTR